MMKRSEHNIDEILGSLDGITRAEARPFMHTRVLARLQEDDVKSGWGRTVAFIARPVVAFTCLAAIIATNVFFVINTEKSDSESVTNNAPSVSEEFLQNDNLVLAVNYLEASE